MKQSKLLQKAALTFPETTEEPHFEKISYRVKKKIFATYDKEYHRICLKFNEADQYAFSRIDKDCIYPVPGKWGKSGWTFVELDKLPDDLLIDALTTAYCHVAPQKLSKQVRPAD